MTIRIDRPGDITEVVVLKPMRHGCNLKPLSCHNLGVSHNIERKDIQPVAIIEAEMTFKRYGLMIKAGKLHSEYRILLGEN